MASTESTVEPASGTWMSEEYEPGLVSVIVPTYNRAHLIAETLDSVFAQTYRPIELLIVDDGSTDNTAEVVRYWIETHAEPRFDAHFIIQENQGAPAARNHGLRESQGEFIQFLDSDDLLHPEKLERQIRRLQETENDYVWAICREFSDAPHWHPPGPPTPRVNTISDHITRGGMVNTVAGIYRRNLCRSMGAWNENLALWQDGEYNLRLFLRKCQIDYMPDVLVAVRVRHGARISDQFKGEQTIEALKAYESRLVKAGELTATNSDSLAAVYFSHALHALRHAKVAAARASLKEASRLTTSWYRFGRVKGLQFVTFFPARISSSLVATTLQYYRRYPACWRTRVDIPQPISNPSASVTPPQK